MHCKIDKPYIINLLLSRYYDVVILILILLLQYIEHRWLTSFDEGCTHQGSWASVGWRCRDDGSEYNRGQVCAEQSRKFWPGIIQVSRSR